MPKGKYQRSADELNRISKLRINKIPWNKGLTKQTSNILIEVGKKISIKRKQRIEPIRTVKWRENISQALKGRSGLKLDKNPNWKGGRYLDGCGYIMINNRSNQRKHEHRILMEQKLGRKLTKLEVIHHIDGNRSNNNLSNLYLFSTSSEHSLYEGKIKLLSKQLLVGLITLEQFKTLLQLK